MIIEHRASIILFNLLSEIKDKQKTFLIPANVCPIVVLTYLKAGINFEFIDINPDSLCLNEEETIAKIASNVYSYGGVHYVHTLGLENNPLNFFAQIKSLNQDLFIIEDKCLNIPNFRLNELPENVDLEIFSTGYSKYVDIGWGGFGYLQPKYMYHRKQLPYDPLAIEKLTGEIKHNLENHQEIRYEDSNWLGDTSFSTSPENYQLLITSKLSEINTHKESINAIYTCGLPKEIQFSKDYQNWRFNIKVANRNDVLKKIFESGLFASTHYCSVTNLFGKPDAVCAKECNDNIINLFNDNRISIENAQKLISIIKEYLN